MALSFETKTLSVGELFSGSNIFRMPIFQRPYSWTEETALELFGDIHQAMERTSSGNYFLGPLIVAQSATSHPWEVVDGQQRLVTISIMLAILRDLLPLGPLQEELQQSLRRPEQQLRALPEEPRVRLRPSERDLFESCVQRRNGTRSLPDDAPTDPGDRLLAVIQAVRDDIGPVDNSYVKRLSRFILNGCNFVRIQAQNLDDAYVLFRSLNSRGVPLNELDIIRAELVGANYDPDLATSIAKCWDDIQVEIGHDKFLKYVRTVISLVKPEALADDLRHVLREVLKDPKAAVAFRRYLTSFLQSYVALDDGTLRFGVNSAEINRIVACLRTLPFDDWRTPALVWLAQQPNPREAVEFLKLLESLALALFILGKTRRQLSKRFNDVTAEALHRTALSNRGALHLSNEERVQLSELLDRPIPSRKKFLRHLLLRLNALLLHPGLPPHFPDDAQIEHVLPQRPNGNSEWRDLFPDERERKELCELMGNYALLTGRMNKSARNYDFAKKKEILFALSSVSMFPLTSTLAPYGTWRERDIRKRHSEMLRLLKQVLPI